MAWHGIYAWMTEINVIQIATSAILGFMLILDSGPLCATDKTFVPRDQLTSLRHHRKPCEPVAFEVKNGGILPQRCFHSTLVPFATTI